METLSRQVNRRLHEEHVATLALCSRLEAALASGKPDAALLRAAVAAIEGEIEHHFAFEEAELFPRLSAAGDGDMVALFVEEHAAVRDAARRFIAAVKRDPADRGLRPLGLEFTERLASHAQKEEMSMLPALEDLLDEAVDAELIAGYIAA